MGPLEELLQNFEDKLETIQKVIGEFDENMDYATHCNLQGFVEGLGYAIDEIKDRLGQGEQKTKRPRKGTPPKRPKKT